MKLRYIEIWIFYVFIRKFLKVTFSSTRHILCQMLYTNQSKKKFRGFSVLENCLAKIRRNYVENNKN